MKLKKLNKKSGFTLLEIIIVIIIVGVLASLALPRFFTMVDTSTAAEALTNLGQLRKSIERCAAWRDQDITNCTPYANLDMQDPGGEFTYAMGNVTSATQPYAYDLTATHDSNGGVITFAVAGPNVSKSGTGPYVTID